MNQKKHNQVVFFAKNNFKMFLFFLEKSDSPPTLVMTHFISLLTNFTKTALQNHLNALLLVVCAKRINFILEIHSN